jgi:hypothetical protein
VHLSPEAADPGEALRVGTDELWGYGGWCLMRFARAHARPAAERDAIDAIGAGTPSRAALGLT